MANTSGRFGIPDQQLAYLSERRRNGTTLRELAREFGVSHETIRAALRRYAALESERLEPVAMPAGSNRDH